MKTFESHKLLNDLSLITQENIKVTEKKFLHFSEAQKNWKPNEVTWSLFEIFAHLNEYANYYHPVLKEKIGNTRFKNAKENFVSSPLGRSAWKSMKLGNAKNVKRKFNSPKDYNPGIVKELVSKTDIKDFLTRQKELLNILKLSEEVNLKKVKVPIFISRIVRLRLGDALMFCIYHNERHIEQALKLIQNANFPKKK
ncbi:MAG: DinB family protein [Lishizhenia sp.]